ncbi:hypothetical protein Tco_0616627 [Tanacetum coccineum]
MTAEESNFTFQAEKEAIFLDMTEAVQTPTQQHSIRDFFKLRNKTEDTTPSSAFPNPTAKTMEVLIKTLLMPLSNKTILDSHCFIHELKREMNDDLEYVNSLEKELDELESEKADFSNIYDLLLEECVSKDVTCSYLHSMSHLNANTELQCMYLHKVKECECLALKLSKRTESVNKEVHNNLLKSFSKLEKHSISLELSLQHCKEQMKNNPVCKENASNVFRKEREQYHEIQDLKAQMQDKNMVINELKKLILSCEMGVKQKEVPFKTKAVPSSQRRLNLPSQGLVVDPMRVAINKYGKKPRFLETDIQEKEQKESQKQPNQARDEKDKAKVRQKASDYDNSDPVPPRQNVVPTAEKTDSSQQGLEIFLLSPLLEEYYNPTHDQAEENNNDQAPNASFQEADFLSILI